MMPSRKDNLYIIRMRGSISSVKPRWWERNAFPLSSTRCALLCFFLKEVKVPWSICLLKCFTNMLLNTDVWWSFSTVKFTKVSFQERTQESGRGAQGKRKLQNYVQGHCAEDVLKLLKKCIAVTINSPGATGAYFYQDTFLLFILEISFKAGKTNVTVKSPGSFAYETITFAEPFSGGKQVKVFASFGHSVNNQARGNGAAIWVESADRTQFRACIYEYSNGSNSTAEINWIALQSAPKGAQLGTTSLDSWTTGTECKKNWLSSGTLCFAMITYKVPRQD